MNNNFNIDENTVNKLKSMMDNGNLNDLISQVPPDMIKNFSNMINSGNNNPNNNNVSNNKTSNVSDDNNSNGGNLDDNNSNTSSNNFDFSNIDVNTIMKVKSIMEKMNNNNDPRANLLHSLRPYLRDEKKSKLDQYSNLLNMANLMELFNQNNSQGNKVE